MLSIRWGGQCNETQQYHLEVITPTSVKQGQQACTSVLRFRDRTAVLFLDVPLYKRLAQDYLPSHRLATGGCHARAHKHHVDGGPACWHTVSAATQEKGGGEKEKASATGAAGRAATAGCAWAPSLLRAG